MSSYPLHTGLEFRSIVSTDLDAWLELVARIEAAQNSEWHMSRSDLQEIIESAQNPVSESAIIGCDAHGVPRAYGFNRRDSGSLAPSAYGGVDPHWLRQGVGNAILAWQEHQLKEQLGQEDAQDAVVRTFSRHDSPGYRALLISRGYQIVRNFSEMLRSLEHIPLQEVPSNVLFESFTPRLSEAVRVAHNESFAMHWGSDPYDVGRWNVMVTHDNFRPELSLVALDRVSGEIAGYLLTTYDPLKETVVGRKEGHTDLLGVVPTWRGGGIASALLARAMTFYKNAGMDHASLDVDAGNTSGALGVYERMGYQAIKQTPAWEKNLKEV